MIIARTVAELRAAVSAAREQGLRVGFVPTMGFLHEGHLSLCDVARAHADLLVMSAFVNPLQFGTGEDLERYPRAEVRDARLAEQRSVDVLFLPAASEMYPDGEPQLRVTAPRLSQRLCGAYRPGHFDGVLTVVAKLFNQVRADIAVFGQKDLQQAALVKHLVRDLDFDVGIVVAPIVREPDGLAMSSRNVYLSAAERTAATALSRALHAAQDAFTSGELTPAVLLSAARAVLVAEPAVTAQYVELVDPDTLDTPARARRGDAIALAAFVGSTRLIDNHLLA